MVQIVYWIFLVLKQNIIKKQLQQLLAVTMSKNVCIVRPNNFNHILQLKYTHIEKKDDTSMTFNFEKCFTRFELFVND